MPGPHVTRKQVQVYMTKRQTGRIQQTASAQAGFSRRTGVRVDADPGHYQHRQGVPRTYRTRADPFAAVWQSEIEPLLTREPKLQAITLLGDLQERHPGNFADGLLRTLQRRVRSWHALHGAAGGACFPQEHPPGETLIADFTVADELAVTLAGEFFPHRLLHARLSCSGWQFVRVVLFGESYTAFSEGLHLALEALGGVPQVLRTDSLSAAYRNLARQEQEDVTAAYAAFCAHYDMRASRCNPGESHENGSIESPNGHLKNRIDQALRLRGSRDFSDVTAYRAWVDILPAAGNARRSVVIDDERRHLRALPAHAPVTWTNLTARVTTFSTIVVRKGVYSVPDRLIGHLVNVHLYDDRLECFLGAELIQRMPRLPRSTINPDQRQYLINYRHIADSLRRKPGALLHLRYRDFLHPTPVYRAAWDALLSGSSPRQACRSYAGILHLAFRACCEAALEIRLKEILSIGALPELTALEAIFDPPRISDVPKQSIVQHELSSYDAIFTTAWAQPEECTA